MGIRVLLSATLCLISGMLTLSHATLYEHRTDPNLDVVYLGDPNVDMALREHFISTAASVDMMSFSLTSSDVVGASTLVALRTAADAGAPVRVIFDGTGNVAEGDPTTHPEQLIADTRLRRPGEVIAARPLAKMLNGLAFDDFVHSKILIVNRGTPRELIFVGGRNHGISSLSWGDSAVVLRRIDPTKPWSGEDYEAAFDQSMDVLSKSLGPVAGKAASPSALEALKRADDRPLLQTKDHRRDYEKIRDLLEKPPARDDVLAQNQFRPVASQLSSNDLLYEVLDKSPGYFVGGRGELHNDTIQMIHSLLSKAHSLQLSGYGVALPDEIFNEAMKLVYRGGQIRLITNGQAAMVAAGDTKMKKIVMRAASDYTLGNLLPIMEAGEHVAKRAGATGGGGVQTFFLDRAKTQAPNAWSHPYSYLHRKCIIIDHRYVFMGSDNLTHSSARKNDEIYGYFDDPKFAAYLEKLSDRELSALFTQKSLADVRAEYATRPVCSMIMERVVKQIF